MATKYIANTDGTVEASNFAGMLAPSERVFEQKADALRRAITFLEEKLAERKADLQEEELRSRKLHPLGTRVMTPLDGKGTIVQLDPDDQTFPYNVYLDGQEDTEWYRHEELLLLAQDDEPALQAGDKVVAEHVGSKQEGVIESISGSYFNVRFSGCGCLMPFEREGLERAS